MAKRNCIVVIPARGSSKRIKQKNIKKFCGKPIISYAIKNAIKSKLFDEIIVSTDNLKIKKIAKNFGASVPFIRPKNISGNFTSVVEVISHTVKIVKHKYNKPLYVCCLFPTTPLLDSRDLVRSFHIFKKSKWNYLFAATKFNHPPEKGFALNFKKGLKMILPEDVNKYKRTQDFKTTYHDAGQFYWAKSDTWLEKKKIFTANSSVYLKPNSKLIDIDTLEDWSNAESAYYFKKRVGK